jgi:RNA polymerase sigma-70 factor (ECF subfamily)
MEDESLLIARAKTEKEAFGELYERYVDRIYSYVLYRTGNEAEAEDLTARIFERAMKHIGNYEHRGAPFAAWLYRIAHNLVANHHRDRSRRKVISLDDLGYWKADIDSPETMAVILEDREKLLEVVRRLPPDRQELLVLKFVDRLSNAAIGDIMGRSEGAIKSLYHRTLLSLRDDWHSDEEEEQVRGSGLRKRLDSGLARLKKEQKALRERFS